MQWSFVCYDTELYGHKTLHIFNEYFNDIFNKYFVSSENDIEEKSRK